MALLYEKEYSKKELLELVGDISQIAYALKEELLKGSLVPRSIWNQVKPENMIWSLV
jgi:hypothetical protein